MTSPTQWVGAALSHSLKPFNQLVFIPHVEPVEPKATPTIVQHGVTYPQGT